MTERAVASAVGAPGTAARRFRSVSLRAVLLLAILLPTLGMVVLAAMAGVRAQSQRTAADRLEDDAAELVGIIAARAAVADEETVSSVVSIAADLGVGIDELAELYGEDYAAQLETARSAVDADAVMSTRAALVEGRARLDDVRREIDAGQATFDEVRSELAALTAAIDRVWLAQFERVSDDVESDVLSGSVHARLDVLRSTFHALSDGSARAVLAIQAVLDDELDAPGLLSATYRFEAATEGFPDRLGPEAARTWQEHLDDPATDRFEATLDAVTASVLAGTRSPLAADPVAFGEAFIDGAAWGRGLADTVQAAGFDLQAAGAREAERATRDLQVQVAVATVLTVLSLVGALAVARRITQPVEHLERAAHQIHEGVFELEPIEPTGPRELYDTATAFNDMASTLAAVESHAVALADDPDAPILSGELPGRTGLALQVALNRVRSSIQVAEQRRRELEVAATHDALTGLLNRAAAFEMIGRDLARVEREGGTVMALFVDLDGLKPINDRHGHAAGDDALRMTADALRAATRASDVVARFGGDEFLVAGVVDDDPAEVEEAAERIRQRVGEKAVICADERIALQCSVGMAMGGAGTTVEALIQAADAALYEAKRKGRNQVSWHPSAEAAER